MAEKPAAAGGAPDPYDVDFNVFFRAIPLKKILIGAAAALACVYAVDFVLIHLSNDQFDTVTVTRVYAEALKGKKIDYESGGSSDVQCVKSLFPHFDDNPCWYLRRHNSVTVEM